MTNLIKQKLSPEQKRKGEKDLLLIDLLTRIGRERGLRIIIHGGYATDGYLGEVTRFHNDIDVQIYGIVKSADDVVKSLLHAVASSLRELWEFEIEDKGRKEYYHNLLVKIEDTILDIYYLQTKTSPLGKEKIIIKSDGSLSEPQEFGELKAKIGNYSYEIADPVFEVVDKIYKREYRGDSKQEKHVQDIKNLEHVLPQEEIKRKLKKAIGSREQA